MIYFCIYFLATCGVYMFAILAICYFGSRLSDLMVPYAHPEKPLITWISLITAGTNLAHMYYSLICDSVVQGLYVSLCKMCLISYIRNSISCD